MNKIFFFTGLLMLACQMLQAQERVKEYDVQPAIAVRMPLQSDSINFKGERFTITKLLKTTLDLHSDIHSRERLYADSTGYVHVEKAIQGNLFYLFSSQLRTERFMHGTLHIYAPVRFEVFVNDKSMQTKITTEESLAQVRPVDIHLRLEPERNYEIIIKLLSTAEDSCSPALKCEFEKAEEFSDITCQISPDLPNRLSVANTTFGSRVQKVSLSPDGKYLLTVYSNSYAGKNPRSYCKLTEVKSGRTILPNSNAKMRWMPSSSKLYYTAKGKRQNDLIVFDPVTQQEEIMISNIPEGNFTWSPTENFLIYSFPDKEEKEENPLKRLLHPEDRIPESRKRYHLVKYDLNTGLAERLTYGANSVKLNDISPDGKRLLCTSSRSDITKNPFTFTTLFEIDLATLKVDTLINWDGYLQRGAYSPDGSRLLLTGGPEAFGGIAKNCGPHPVANDYDTQAFIMELSSREIIPITRNFNPAVEFLQWNRTDNCIYFNTTDKDCLHVYRYIPRTGEFEILPLKEEAITCFSLPSHNASIAAYCGESDTCTGAAYLYDMRKKNSKLLADPMRPELNKIELGHMESWNFTSSDGTLIEGRMCLPPAFDSRKKYPLIVYYYGGTTPTTRGITSPYSAQLLASRGYVVYIIQPSGTIGYGQEFSARHVNAWGEYTANEIIEGTQKFCATHPFVDAKHVGCLGASYGGFMTMYLQTQTNIFAAAIAHAGISNVTSYWGAGYWGYSYNSVAASGSYPWNNPDLFTKHSPLFNADKINTPLLLLHGTADTNVPIGESIQLYNALKILGKNVELVTIEGEDHFILNYPKYEQWHATIMAWFARWLQDSPAWWDDLYPERYWGE